jgi:hypothetical protein
MLIGYAYISQADTQDTAAQIGLNIEKLVIRCHLRYQLHW